MALLPSPLLPDPRCCRCVATGRGAGESRRSRTMAGEPAKTRQQFLRLDDIQLAITDKDATKREFPLRSKKNKKTRQPKATKRRQQSEAPRGVGRGRRNRPRPRLRPRAADEATPCRHAFTPKKATPRKATKACARWHLRPRCRRRPRPAHLAPMAISSGRVCRVGVVGGDAPQFAAAAIRGRGLVHWPETQRSMTQCPPSLPDTTMPPPAPLFLFDGRDRHMQGSPRLPKAAVRRPPPPVRTTLHARAQEPQCRARRRASRL